MASYAKRRPALATDGARGFDLLGTKIETTNSHPASRSQVCEWRLYADRKHLLSIVSDFSFLGTWRIRYPDGLLSDMVSLTRARDAAVAIAARWYPDINSRALDWRWHEHDEPQEARTCAESSTPVSGSHLTLNGGRHE